MKIITLRLTLIILIAAIITGCKKNSVIGDKQAILFQLDYVNYTMNYQHYGFIIDNEGNVLTYNNPEKWNYPDRELRISASQIAENMALCTHSGIKIPKEELLKYSGHIKNIAATKVTAVKNAADNTGSTEYLCYQLSENSEMYKGSVIRMEGDFTCENLNFFSKKVADWMKTISIRLTIK
jgi:hypothetical protein